MNCDDFSSRLPDLLYGEIPPDHRVALQRHESTCDPCRRKYRSLVEVQTLLDRWAPPPPRPALDISTFDGQAMRRGPQSRRQRRGLLVGTLAGAIAAVLGFAVLTLVDAKVQIEGRRLSIGFGDSSVAPAPRQARGTTADQYMLLLYEVSAETQDPAAAHESAIVEEYRAWAESLRAEGRLYSGEKLEADAGWTLGPRHPPGEPAIPQVRTDGAVLAGFFVVLAESYERAMEIAGTCPHLKYGGTIEIRRIERYRRERSPSSDEVRGNNRGG